MLDASETLANVPAETHKSCSNSNPKSTDYSGKVLLLTNLRQPEQRYSIPQTIALTG